jgi:DNA-binding HxlR family transcriptional regulator
MVAHLGAHAMRYSDLRRAIPQLSDKVLAAALRELENLGIVARATSETESGPVAVDRLTTKGHAMAPVLRLACAWARTHAAEYGVDFLHGPPCGPKALETEFAAIVAVAMPALDVTKRQIQAAQLPSKRLNLRANACRKPAGSRCTS